MAALATVDDLIARNVDVQSSPDRTATAEVFLTAASAAVRSAAGQHISQVTSTVTVEARAVTVLHLPAPPVTAVTAVTVDYLHLSGGSASPAWVLLPGGRLRRRDGRLWGPSLVTVTYTHGLVDVPADVVDLVCGLAAGALEALRDGYNPGIGLASVRVDDVAETYTTGADARSGQFDIPEVTRRWLHDRFSGGAYSVGADQ